MKKKVLQNNNGVVICDSIVMSVRKKRPNLRKPEAIFIAVMGFVSVIMSFLGMFEFEYRHSTLVMAATGLSIFYIVLSLIGKRALWVMLGSVITFIFAAYKMIESIATGFKFMYNIVYSDSYNTQINYYKSLPAHLEEQCVTTLFVFCVWLLAMIIYFFTIYHPNPILPLLATFPILEVGLYNGIEIPIFWGIMTVAYWLALLAMSTIDIGELSGGSGGFVRKDNVFFPKRQMRLKVTEKCGLFIVITTLIITAVSAFIINISGYERSDELNRKRIEIRDAINSFSLENLAESISRVTSVFGFSFDYENHKLGTTDRLKFKNTTDLIVTIDRKHEGAIYLKEYTGSVYDDNSWSDLSESIYKNQLFSDFKNYSVYPQDFASLFARNVLPDTPTMTIWINSKLRDNKSFAPYGTDNFGNLTYNKDMTVSSKRKDESEFSYKFIAVNNDILASYLTLPSENIYSAGYVYNEEVRERLYQYCNENGLFAYDDVFYTENEMPFNNDEYAYSNGNVLLAQLLQTRYKDFVYKNYLQIPDDKNIKEVREAYADILQYAENAHSASEKLEVLTMIRERIDSQNVYSLSPGKTPSNRDFINYFLLENHKGYCIHYATSGVMLTRMAGIPARYATGYVIVGEDFNETNANSDGSYTITLKDNRSHAWAEIYLDGYGWVPFEFTAGYSDSSIVTETTTQNIFTDTSTETTTAVRNSARQSTSHRSSRPLSTTTNTTTATKATGGIASKHHDGNNTGKTFPLKTILIVIISVGGIVLITYLRRRIIITSRIKNFTTGGNSQKSISMYSYAEKLLASQKIRREDLNFIEFAEFTEKNMGGKLFSEGDFSRFMDISLRAGFSNTSPDNEELKFCRKFVTELSCKIYEQSDFIHKFIIKFITVLK
ncbi:MAG: transglutaminase-like domain-containing protein [Ruminococcus sp.]|nr:transglutaminase-like domain-containing protein [Ruminococcus sp.]